MQSTDDCVELPVPSLQVIICSVSILLEDTPHCRRKLSTIQPGVLKVAQKTIRLRECAGLPNIYQLVDVIKGEQALTDLAAVQLDAGSQPPRRRRKYNVVDQRLKLKEAYVGSEKTLDRYIVGVAYNLSRFV